MRRPVLDSLYAARDVPLPAGARRPAYLHRVPLTEDEMRSSRRCWPKPSGRLEATELLKAQLVGG
jgi:hypothetical protein